MPAKTVAVLPSWFPSKGHPHRGQFFLNHAECLRRLGFDVHFLVFHPKSLRDFGRSDAPPENLGFPMSWRSALVPRGYGPSGGRRTVSGFVDLFETARRDGFQPDWIYAQATIWAGVAAAEISRRAGIPFVLTAHYSGLLGSLPKHHENAVRTAVCGAAVASAVSQPLAERLKEISGRTSIDILPNAIELASWPVNDGPREDLFVSVGNLVEVKGYDRLLKAFAAVARSTSARLVIVGEGPLKPNLLRQVEALQLAGRVELVGKREPKDIAQLLSRAKAFVSSSLVETFGVAMVEALATGTPVIATRSGGPNAFVTSDVGALVDVGDEGSLGDAMVGALAWDKDPLACRAAASQFSLEAVTDRFREILPSDLRP